MNDITAALTSVLVLPQVIPFRSQPQALMRAILGHISAQGVNRYAKGARTQALRDYMLDESRPLPDGIKIFYWVYPSTALILARDAVHMDMDSTPPYVMWFLKFFPVAFMVAWDGPERMPFPVQALHVWRHLSFDEEAVLPVRFAPLPPLEWPEAPTDRSATMYGGEAVHVVRRTLM